jgi:hypothetical protein
MDTATMGAATRTTKRLGLFAAFGCVVAFVAICNPATADPAQVTAPGGRYFIEFRARSSTYIGHTFIHYGRVDSDGRIVESSRAGLIPEVSAWKGLIFPVRGSIREYKDDTRLPTRVIYRRSLTAQEYARVAATVRRMQATEDLWHGVFFNCNDFAIEIAETLHMRRPPSLMPPDVWVDALRALNEP